jgi:hypothetical protein
MKTKVQKWGNGLAWEFGRNPGEAGAPPVFPGRAAEESQFAQSAP